MVVLAEYPFKDHFSKQAGAYRAFRPHYPEALFAHLATLLDHHELAWDCATGSGQAALGLTPYFRKIIATDASKKQLAQAEPHEKISYRLAAAEQSFLAPHSVDLVQVAQALHWFEWQAFYAEVRRVLRPDGLLAIYWYNLASVSPKIDAIISHFYNEIVGDYWPPERAHIEADYRPIPFPFACLETPTFAMRADWTLSQLLGYLSTWSAVQKYRDATASDPLGQIREALNAAWGDSNRVRVITWPLHVWLARL